MVLEIPTHMISQGFTVISSTYFYYSVVEVFEDNPANNHLVKVDKKTLDKGMFLLLTFKIFHIFLQRFVVDFEQINVSWVTKAFRSYK